MPPQPPLPSRRTVLTTGSTLLAALGLDAALPGTGLAAARDTRAARGGRAAAELAAYRPVSVSSTAYAPTPASFAVDGLTTTGVKGSGWRAADGDPQWIAVDLQADCEVERVRLTFEATADDPPYEDAPGDNPRNDTTGQEILSSCAVDFVLETSRDGEGWTPFHRESSGTGGVVDVALPRPVTARRVRLTVHRRSNANPLGLNGFEVYGSCRHERPAATGWTDWGTHHRTPPALHVADDGTVPLESGWELTMDDRADGDGAALSRPGADTSRWLPAVVPGTVLTSLVAAGHLPDPVAGMNNLHVPEALSRHSWWYRRAFRLPHGLATGRGRHVWLEFDGVNHKAEIHLNGRRVGDQTFPFARGAFDVTELLAPGGGEQALAVRITPMPFPGSPGDKGPEGRSFVDAGANMMMRNAPTYLAVSGWDWMPAVRDRVSGIWNHVRLRSTGAAVLGDPRVDTVLPDLPSTRTAELTVTVPVRNASGSALRVAVSAAFGDVRVGTTVTVPAHGSADAVLSPGTHPQLRLRDPELWWPNGYGRPALHELTLVARTDGAESDRRTVRFGMRQFAYDYDVPLDFSGGSAAEQTVAFAPQHARHVRVLCGSRATGWGFSLWGLSVLDGEGSATDLALHREAVASSVDEEAHAAANATDGDAGTRWSSAFEDDQWLRVDLGSAVSFDRVVLTWEQAYARTYTIQVSDDGEQWREVESVDNATVPLKISVNGVRVLCRGGNWGWDELLRRMDARRMDAAVRMHRDMNFTMIRNWVGSSDREEFFAACDTHGILVWNDFPDAWAMDAPDREAFNDLARDTVRRYRVHPSIVVWCGANEGNPPEGINTGMRQAVEAEAPHQLYQNNSAGGIVTGGGPYGWVEPARYFDAATYGSGTFGFHTEIGMPTVPTAETMRRLVGDGDAWPIGGAWYHHDWSEKGNQAPQNYKAAIEERLGEATGLDDFCGKAQFVNYENTRAMFEAWNSRLWKDASGLMLWMSHPAWYSTVWQTYDYDFDVNGTYYGARSSCEPLHVQADPRDGRVLAVNHTPHAVRGARVTARFLDLRGHAVREELSGRVDVAASATAEAFEAPFGDDLPAFHLLRLRLTDGRGRVLSENTYWRYRTPRDMRAALGDAPRTRVTADAGTARRSGDRRELTARVRNEGPAVAAMVRLSLRDAHGERVLPALYGDNYLWLLPGESRTVAVSWPADALPSGRPRLHVAGHNLAGA